jgi:hypothetical protein
MRRVFDVDVPARTVTADALPHGQKLRVLTVVDAYTRECIALSSRSSSLYSDATTT